jgi:hypothetical protein
MSNPNYNTVKVRKHNDLNPKQAILNHLSNPELWENGGPKYKEGHIRSMIDMIDNVPPEEKQQLSHWRTYLADLLDRQQREIA